MEEFEFKPLTDGLGFHKKKADEDRESQLPPIIQREPSTLPHISESLEIKKKELEEKVSGLPFDFSQTTTKMPSLFSPTLPRESKPQEQREVVSVPKFHSPKLKSIEKDKTSQLNQTKNINSAISSEVHGAAAAIAFSNKIETTPVEPQYIKSYNFLTSIFLDVFVVLGLSVLFTLALVFATGLDVILIVSQSIRDSGTQVGIVMLIYSVGQLYTLLARSFFGQTLGEWSIEQQLGTVSEQETVSYVFKLLLRNIVLTLTGFVLLPVFSRIAKTDLTARLCGVSLYKKES